jgi:hypothetical protein
MRRKSDEARIHPPVVERRRISGLCFVDDLLASCALSSIGMQKVTDSVKEFRGEWEFTKNTDRTEIIEF